MTIPKILRPLTDWAKDTAGPEIKTKVQNLGDTLHPVRQPLTFLTKFGKFALAPILSGLGVAGFDALENKLYSTESYVTQKLWPYTAKFPFQLSSGAQDARGHPYAMSDKGLEAIVKQIGAEGGLGLGIRPSNSATDPLRAEVGDASALSDTSAGHDIETHRKSLLESLRHVNKDLSRISPVTGHKNEYALPRLERWKEEALQIAKKIPGATKPDGTDFADDSPLKKYYDQQKKQIEAWNAFASRASQASLDAAMLGQTILEKMLKDGEKIKGPDGNPVPLTSEMLANIPPAEIAKTALDNLPPFHNSQYQLMVVNGKNPDGTDKVTFQFANTQILKTTSPAQRNELNAELARRLILAGALEEGAIFKITAPLDKSGKIDQYMNERVEFLRSMGITVQVNGGEIQKPTNLPNAVKKQTQREYNHAIDDLIEKANKLMGKLGGMDKADPLYERYQERLTRVLDNIQSLATQAKADPSLSTETQEALKKASEFMQTNCTEEKLGGPEAVAKYGREHLVTEGAPAPAAAAAPRAP